ncbi:hypothetical protein K32_49090 [Kaistia sp. 32K]|uniref:hypothetical protein n=1 Tax=Kaistia sp. 32K TaxID=2795690 RepID=UPI001915DC76|nr:hypothetical protein [Kaistia sp. 32K]BCP56292.1 hypothetical protein K32_49090 [Kaistia sp. 32K]
MGTRNLTCVVLGGEYKVAQYGQWDGYPSGQGLTALRFLRGMDKPQFTEKVAAISYLTQEQCDAINAELRDDSGLMGEGKKYGHLSRDRGADILNIISQADTGGISLLDSLTFAADSLFCEFAYVIDLDKGTFEVFRGFNQEPLAEGERFAFLAGKADQQHRGEKYTPIKHWHTFQLDALPTEEEFLAILEPKEDEEE